MKNFNNLIQAQFNKMSQSGKLFRSALSGSEIYNLYLESFDNDPIFRDPNSSYHKCNTCNSFLKRYGNIVSLDENNSIQTIFDIEIVGEFEKTAKVLSEKIKEYNISEVFIETYANLKIYNYTSGYSTLSEKQKNYQLGVAKNFKKYTYEESEKFGGVKPNEIYEFNHIHFFINKDFIDFSNESEESLTSVFKDAKNVFQRTMESIPLNVLQLVKELIDQDSLLDGKTHLFKVEKMIELKTIYDSIQESKRENWCWSASYKLPFAKFRNELIGTLCTEIADGDDLNVVCQKWNKRVDPVNYMKTSAPITSKQIEDAKKFVLENGYEESFNRRFATIEDIKVSEILHANVGKGEIKKVSIFDSIKSTVVNEKKLDFNNVEEINIEKFMKDILPNCSSVEAFLKNSHENNMVSLTTSVNQDSKPIFKWSNNYSWTFNGNLAGKSQIKESVKSLGGKVDGVLRFSIMWSVDNNDDSDLDAHCIEPDSNKIYFSDKESKKTKGNLDIDIRKPSVHKKTGKNVVENITFPSIDRLLDGNYNFMVHQFSAADSKGFKAEIEFEGKIYSYEYNKNVKHGEYIKVATVKFDKKTKSFSIEHDLQALNDFNTSKDIYNLETNKFHKVNLICLSPNYWEDNKVGNKHYFFMLENCKSTKPIRSFHNENLNDDLIVHRKVIEVLASTNMIESTDSQLSGLGFNATVRDELVVKIEGTFKRIIKIKF